MDKLVLENAKKVILNPPEETRTKEIKRTDVYKTLNIKTRKIEIASQQEVVTDLKEILKNIFYAIDTNFGTIEVKFANVQLPATHATSNVKTEGWVFFPNTFGRRVTRLRVGREPPDTKVKKLVEADLPDTSKKVEIVQASNSSNFNS